MADSHPPHIYLDDTWYIISAVTHERVHLLRRQEAKALVRDALRCLVMKFGITLRAWVILDNHYHMLLRTDRGHDLPTFIARLHGSTSRQINVLDSTTGRRVWHNYWDSCIRTDRDLWTRFNYIHQNPVKHGYVRRLDDWLFSSYLYYLRTKGGEWLQDCWSRYPVVDFLEGDEFPPLTTTG